MGLLAGQNEFTQTYKKNSQLQSNCDIAINPSLHSWTTKHLLNLQPVNIVISGQR
jgi:hypothetical protein